MPKDKNNKNTQEQNNQTPTDRSGHFNEDNLSKLNQTVEHRDPAKLLGSILRGEIEELDDLHYPFIINGHKINNKLLRIYIDKLRATTNLSDTEILNMLVLVDEAVEKGLWTNELFLHVRDNPDLLNKITEKEVDDETK